MEKYRILSDFFAIPGLFCLFLGLLRWLANQGALQGFGYVFKNALRLLTFQTAKPYTQKESRGRETRPLLLVGMICIAISGLFAGFCSL